MIMGSTSLRSLSKPFLSFTSYSHSKPKTPKFLQVRSQSFRDEGSPSNMVDANLDVLRTRMEQVMKNEKFEYTTLKRMKNIGWEYNSITADYETQDKNGYATMMTGTTEVVGLVIGSFGLVFLFGSLPIFLISLIVHLCH